MTEQAIFDRVKALIDENAALKAANIDQSDKLKRAQKRIAELEGGRAE